MSTWVVVGEGAWPEALAGRLLAGGHEVHRLEAPEAVASAERVVLAPPAGLLTHDLYKLAPHLRGHHRVVTLVRGLTAEGLRPTEAVLEWTAVRQVAVLAGAAGPAAVQSGHPAALVVGSAFPTWAEDIQGALTSETLRIYTESDMPGVELSAALAAVLGVALGVARALAVGAATEATALTRALAEMDRLVTGLGGRTGTAYGLAGLGMLAQLAFDGTGEAFQAGARLARGDHEGAASDFPELAELAARLSQRAGRQRLRAPLVDTMAALFQGRLPVKDALAGLMARVLRTEKS